MKCICQDQSNYSKMRTNRKRLNQYTSIFIDSGWITFQKLWHRTETEDKRGGQKSNSSSLNKKFDLKNPYLFWGSVHLCSINWIISINISRKRLSNRGKQYEKNYSIFRKI